ncbi:MAG: hypothetical protein PHF31_16080 [Methylobacter sp.]|nr:hypothetical protein [Methylobacter sp.]
MLTWKNGDLKPKPAVKAVSWKEKAKSKLDDFKATRRAKEKFGDAKETVRQLRSFYQAGNKSPRLS